MIVLLQLIKHVVAICGADATVRVEILQFESHLFLFDYRLVKEFVDCFTVVVEFELICRKLELPSMELATVEAKKSQAIPRGALSA